MKRIVFILVLIPLFFSCNSNQAVKEEVKRDSTALLLPADSGSVKSDAHYFWAAELDSKKGLVMTKTSPLPKDSLTATRIIQMLNEVYPKIPLQFKRVSKDTLFVQIGKSGYLTRQIGSSGAQLYLAEVTYNLTEIPGINFVDIYFKAGDHASPATYARTDFVRLTK